MFPGKLHFKNSFHFGIFIHILSGNIYFRLLRKKKELKNQQLFDGITDITLFDRVEGLG